MNKYIKILIILLMLAIIFGIVITLLYTTDEDYNNNYSAKELYMLVENSFYTEGGTKMMDEDIILEFVDEAPDYIEDYIVVKANNAKNINEIGIFKVEKESLNEMKSIIDKYVIDLQNSYRAMEYFPQEVEKIDGAKIKVLGNYIIYSFLNEKDSNEFYKAIKNTLTK